MKSFYPLFFLALSLWSCDDIFEQELDRARIEVVAPKDGTSIPSGEVTFLWRPLPGARTYRVTVVSPGFDQASRVWADTTLRVDSLHAADRFTLRLDEGDYQWSLSAANGAYRTPEQVYTLRVDPAPADEPQPSSGEEGPGDDEGNPTPPSDEQEGNNSPGDNGNSASDDTNEPADGDTSEA